MGDKAHIGDTIVITEQGNDRVGKEFVVVECPDVYKGTLLDTRDSDVVWTEHSSGWGETLPTYWHRKSYEIIRRVSGKQDKHDVDSYLSRQLDDNLRDIFG